MKSTTSKAAFEIKQSKLNLASKYLCISSNTISICDFISSAHSFPQMNAQTNTPTNVANVPLDLSIEKNATPNEVGIFDNMPNTKAFVMKMQEVLSTIESVTKFHDDLSNLLVDSHGYGRSKCEVLKAAKEYGVILPKEFTGDHQLSCESSQTEKTKCTNVRVFLTRLKTHKLLKNENGSYVAHVFESSKNPTGIMSKSSNVSSKKMNQKTDSKLNSSEDLSDDDEPLVQMKKRQKVQCSNSEKGDTKKQKVDSRSESSFPSVGLMSKSSSAGTVSKTSSNSSFVSLDAPYGRFL